MALKPDRQVESVDISFFMGATGVKGQGLCYSTAGSGAAMDQATALAQIAANPSGLVPLGVMLNDVVNYDLTKQHLNQHRDEVQIGSKVCILRRGWVVTDQITPAVTVTGGSGAYLDANGLFTGLVTSGTPKVGQWLSSKDPDGFAKLYVTLPL